MAVLDAFIAITEDLDLKIFRGNMPPDPLVCSRLRVRISAPPPRPHLKILSASSLSIRRFSPSPVGRPDTQATRRTLRESTFLDSRFHVVDSVLSGAHQMEPPSPLIS